MKNSDLAGMTHHPEDLAAAILCREFNLSSAHENPALEEVRLWLTGRLKELIDHQQEQLFRILYRIDIPESKAMEALASSGAAARLADLIIARQIEKARSRSQHGASAGDELKEV